MTFNDMGLIAPITRALSDVGYSTPTDIQRSAIPAIMDKKDIIGCAQTGTGKTAAFALPILQHLYHLRLDKKKAVHTLVLAPTRELVLQIAESFSCYGKYLPLKQVAIFGGVPQNKQVDSLQKGVDIVIATPGRLLDLMSQGYVQLSQIEVLVIDEADHMLDLGFIADVKKIIAKLPAKRQTLFFSATMPVEIRKFAHSILHAPMAINASLPSSTTANVQQSVYFVEQTEKTRLLIHLLNGKNVQRTLVFTRTKRGADRLSKQLSKTGIYAAAIHGDKSQNARQKALSGFKNNQIKVLIATDIAARGIDIDELPYVVNFELPNIPETYVHRIGRTGRAGAQGIAISFCNLEERTDLKNIQKLIGTKIPVVNHAIHHMAT